MPDTSQIASTVARASDGVSQEDASPVRFPDGWNLARLDSLFDLQQGKALSPEARQGKSLKPFLRTANVLWGRLDLSSLDSMDFTDEEMSRLRLAAGDILVCEGGDVGRTAIWQGEVQDCAYQNHIHRLRPKVAHVDPYFYAYWMQAAIQLLGLYGGEGNKTTIPNLSKGRLSAFTVPQPPLEEQRGIARVLGIIQRAIETQEKVIAAAGELKRSLMKHLFTYGPTPMAECGQVEIQETDIGFIPSHWGVARLGELAELLQYGTSTRAEADAPGQPVLGIRNVVTGRILTSPLRFLAADQNEATKLTLRPGDLLVVRTNATRENIGRIAIYEGLPERALFASYLIRVRVRDSEILPRFLQLYSATEHGQKFLSGRASGAADGKFNINTQTLRSVLLPLPPMAEQQAIVDAVGCIQRKIESEERRNSVLEVLFRALLHHLMTGKIRTKDA